VKVKDFLAVCKNDFVDEFLMYDEDEYDTLFFDFEDLEEDPEIKELNIISIEAGTGIWVEIEYDKNIWDKYFQY